MTRATVTVRLELEDDTDTGAILDSVADLAGALHDHFRPDRYGVKLADSSITIEPSKP